MRLCQVLSGTPYEARGGGGGRQITRHCHSICVKICLAGATGVIFHVLRPFAEDIPLPQRGESAPASLGNSHKSARAIGFIPLSRATRSPAKRINMVRASIRRFFCRLDGNFAGQVSAFALHNGKSGQFYTAVPHLAGTPLRRAPSTPG